MRLMTLEDVEDIEVDPNWSPLYMLGAVCERALKIYKKEKEIAKNISMYQVQENQENSPSRMVEFPKSSNLERDSAIVDGDESNGTTKISAERVEFKKRVMGFDMTGYTCWKSNNNATADHVLTWSVKDKKKGGLISDHNEHEEIHVSRQQRLRREKKLKRPMDHEAEKRRIIRGSPSGLKRKRSYDQEKKCVAKKSNFKRRIQSKTEHIPMPEYVKNRIDQLGKQIKEVKLIIEKQIYKTDASGSHNRLSIPISQIVEKFLRDEEEEYLCMFNDDDRKNSKKVRVIDPSLKIDELELRRWEMKKLRKHKEKSKMSACYVLNGKWTKIRISNNIKMGGRIQIWAVRLDDEELIIALVKLPGEEEGDQVTIKEEEGDQVVIEEEDDDQVTIEKEVDIEEQEGADRSNKCCFYK